MLCIRYLLIIFARNLTTNSRLSATIMTELSQIIVLYEPIDYSSCVIAEVHTTGYYLQIEGQSVAQFLNFHTKIARIMCRNLFRTS
jgi:hypothetical protein